MARVKRINGFSLKSIDELYKYVDESSNIEKGIDSLIDTLNGNITFLHIKGEKSSGKTSYASILNGISKGNIELPHEVEESLGYSRLSFLSYYISPDIFSNIKSSSDILPIINLKLVLSQQGVFKKALKKIHKVSIPLPWGTVGVDKNLNPPEEKQIEIEYFIKLIRDILNKKIYPGVNSGILIILDNLDEIIYKFNMSKFIKQLNDVLLSSDLEHLMFVLISSTSASEHFISRESSLASILKIIHLKTINEDLLYRFIDDNLKKSNLEIEDGVIARAINDTEGNINYLQKIFYRLVDNSKIDKITNENYLKEREKIYEEEFIVFKGIINELTDIHKLIISEMISSGISKSILELKDDIERKTVDIISAVEDLIKKNILIKDDEVFRISNKVVLNSFVKLKEQGFIEV